MVNVMLSGNLCQMLIFNSKCFMLSGIVLKAPGKDK